ncbi:hypothetical protein [Streptacidiphilus sp. EB129]|uniref:mechanosensitive ion channel family protein n=1 Tax=Streptacidiphilus sp. EB129 TaxID=3156262 RepID=UPI0035144F8F
MAQQLALSVNFGQGFSNAWSKVATFIPQFLAFLAILAIGWFVARLIARVLDRLLRRVGSEKLSERAGVSRMLRGSGYDGTGIISKIIYYVILLMALQLALGVFGANPISTMINSIVSWLPKGLVAIVIIIVAMAIANAVRGIVGSALTSTSYGRTLATIAWAFIVALGVIAALGQAGIATSVSQPVLIAILATMTGIAVVGVGGGMIIPMRQRWERWLDAAERETANARGSLDAYQAGRADAMEGQPAKPTLPTTGTAGTTGTSGTTDEWER